MGYILNMPSYDGIGIYCLTDTSNGKRYIGSSVNVKSRIWFHESSFAKKTCSEKLMDAINNGHTFSFSVLEEVPYGENLFYLRERERFYIDKFNTIEDGYNSAKTTAITKEQWLKTLEFYDEGGEVHENIVNMIKKMDAPIYKSNSTDAQIRASVKYNKSRDYFGLRPDKETGQKIRDAAAKAGTSVQGYILQSVLDRIKQEEAGE